MPGDTSLDNSRPSPTHQRPDVRIILPDTFGMRVEHASDVSIHQRTNGSIIPTVDGVTETNGSGSMVASVAVSPAAHYSRPLVRTHPTVPDAEKIDQLFHMIKCLLEALEEYKKKNQDSVEMNLSLLMQLQTGQTKIMQLEQQILQMEKENMEMRNQLKTKVQDSGGDSIRFQPGIKRRFQISSQYTRECAKCKKVFISEETAGNVLCNYHGKAACDISPKMSSKVCGAGDQRGKLLYWACCHKIGTTHQAPPACCRGNHRLCIIPTTSLTAS